MMPRGQVPRGLMNNATRNVSFSQIVTRTYGVVADCRLVYANR